jgi:hypothetical protein
MAIELSLHDASYAPYAFKFIGQFAGIADDSSTGLFDEVRGRVHSIVADDRGPCLR